MNRKLTTLIVLILIAFNSIAKTPAGNSDASKGVSTHVQIKHTISSGGGEISGMNYVVIGSIGQIDAGHVTLGGGHQFIGGILAAPRSNEIFKNSFE